MTPEHALKQIACILSQVKFEDPLENIRAIIRDERPEGYDNYLQALARQYRDDDTASD